MNDLTHSHVLRPFYSFIFISYTPLEICFVQAKRCWFDRESRNHTQIHVGDTTTASSCWTLKAFQSPLTTNTQLITTSTVHTEIIIVPALHSSLIQNMKPSCSLHSTPTKPEDPWLTRFSVFHKWSAKLRHVSRMPGENRERIKSHLYIHTHTITSAHRSQLYLQIIATAPNTTTALSGLAALV